LRGELVAHQLRFDVGRLDEGGRVRKARGEKHRGHGGRTGEAGKHHVK
jgi:hypothetical protein